MRAVDKRPRNDGNLDERMPALAARLQIESQPNGVAVRCYVFDGAALGVDETAFTEASASGA